MRLGGEWSARRGGVTARVRKVERTTAITSERTALAGGDA
jgi:hypothetical protein